MVALSPITQLIKLRIDKPGKLGFLLAFFHFNRCYEGSTHWLGLLANILYFFPGISADISFLPLTSRLIIKLRPG